MGIKDKIIGGMLLVACSAVIVGVGECTLRRVEKYYRKERVADRTKILDINDSPNTIIDILQGDCNGDGLSDYRVYSKNGEQQTYFHAGFYTENKK